VGIGKTNTITMHRNKEEEVRSCWESMRMGKRYRRTVAEKHEEAEAQFPHV